jgi:hypothetical protein
VRHIVPVGEVDGLFQLLLAWNFREGLHEAFLGLTVPADIIPAGEGPRRGQGEGGRFSRTGCLHHTNLRDIALKPVVRQGEGLFQSILAEAFA